jgi:acyl-CoA thioesterase-2
LKKALQDVLDLLDLEPIEINMFRGISPAEGWQRVYGGQVIGQALVAASRTVEDENRIAHSLHGYFLRPGDTTIPIVYSVDRIRDGKSFNTRRVVAIQKGRPIFSMSVSFQVMEEGLHHQIPMPEAAAPEDCPSQEDLRKNYINDIPEEYRDNFLNREDPIEMRFQDGMNDFKPDPMPPHQRVWIRAVDKMPDDVRLHQCVLAYASDMTLMDNAIRPHGIGWTEENFQTASLDHAMWFHQPFRADEWLLYYQDSPYSGGARGFNRGSFFTREGQLIASASQEGLMRLHPPRG